MKILFTADMHIKLGQKNVPVEWAKNRFYGLFSKLRALEKTCDMFVVGGDVFDKIPNMEELELYYDFISDISIPTYIIPGNHEALKKNTTFLSYLEKSTRRINKLVEIVDDFATINGIDFIPYNKLKEYRPGDIDFHSDILVTHVRGEIPPHVKPEVNLDMFSRWKVVLAGDLHSYENCQRNILYPGSPVTTSFHRQQVDTGVIILDTDTLQHEWVKLDLPQLLKVSVRAGEPTPATEYHHTIYEVEGDMSELSSVQDSALIDKKVVRRSEETSLILSPAMTMVEEVSEYLKYILTLDDNTVEQVLKEYNNHASKFSNLQST